jgi:hypothetical protein
MLFRGLGSSNHHHHRPCQQGGSTAGESVTLLLPNNRDNIQRIDLVDVGTYVV